MITYVVLASFTDQGIRNAKDTIKRAHQRRCPRLLWQPTGPPGKAPSVARSP